VLIRADGAEIERIKNQDDIVLARKIGKLYFLLRLVFQGEIGSGLSYGNRREASSEFR